MTSKFRVVPVVMRTYVFIDFGSSQRSTVICMNTSVFVYNVITKVRIN